MSVPININRLNFKYFFIRNKLEIMRCRMQYCFYHANICIAKKQLSKNLIETMADDGLLILISTYTK